MEWMELAQLAKGDPWHRECVAKVAETEGAFLAIRARLSEAERERLDMYICACEEQAHSLTLLALEMLGGK